MPDVVPFMTYEDGIAALGMAGQGVWIHGDSSLHVFRWETVSRRNVCRGWTDHVVQSVAGL